MNDKRQQALQKFADEQALGRVDLELLDRALTHKSYANELKAKSSTDSHPELYNERLEFLGDTVLGMVVANALFTTFPRENEGNLTKKKAQAVCEATLAEVGNKLEIGSYLLMGKGELATGGATRRSNIANAVEAVIGALFLSSGYENTETQILRLWKAYIEEGRVSEDSVDYKSQLQEHFVQATKTRPEYQVLASRGPDHRKVYEVGLFLKGKKLATATGSSRKRAEQEAAKKYLTEIRNSE